MQHVPSATVDVTEHATLTNIELNFHYSSHWKSMHT